MIYKTVQNKQFGLLEVLGLSGFKVKIIKLTVRICLIMCYVIFLHNFKMFRRMDKNYRRLNLF